MPPTAQSARITPNSDGKLIRLGVPPLSGERRDQLAGQVKKMAEAQKIAVRNRSSLGTSQFPTAAPRLRPTTGRPRFSSVS